MSWKSAEEASKIPNVGVDFGVIEAGGTMSGTQITGHVNNGARVFPVGTRGPERRNKYRLHVFVALGFTQSVSQSARIVSQPCSFLISEYA